MIRQPTDLLTAMRWHRRALAGIAQPVHAEDPQPGWYRRRLVKGGPWVPAQIWIEQVLDADTGELTEPETTRCKVNGEEVDAIREWLWLAKNPISQGEFDRMTDEIERAGRMDPLNPILQPERPADVTARAPLPGR